MIKVFFNKLGQSNYLLPSTMDAQERNWLDLPDHVLGIIADLLIDINDYIRFGAVCCPWRCVYTETFHQRRTRPHRQLPLLMIPSEPEPCDFKNQTRSLYSLSEKRVLPNFHVKVPHNKFCRGSSEGWLVTLDENLSDIRLFNPFLSSEHNEIELPILTTFPHEEDEIFNDGFLHKAVLSANPAINPNYVVMAIYGQFTRLAFFKPGDNTWTPLDFEYANIDDVIYFRDQFYLVDCDGTVFSCDVTQPHPKVVRVASLPSYYQAFGMKKYLVESFGNLLHISKQIEGPRGELYYTAGFEVFKLEQSTGKWSKLKSVGECAIFLGDNHSMSLASQDFPVCKPNCIYFTDDYYDGYYDQPDGPHDMGVFNVKDGSIEPHYPLKTKTVHPDYAPPIWIEPTLQ